MVGMMMPMMSVGLATQILNGGFGNIHVGYKAKRFVTG